MLIWHLRYTREIVYGGLFVALIVVAGVCGLEAHSLASALIGMRQLFGLWALGLLLVALLIGPLTSLLPWIPLKAYLVLSRRAVGVSAFVFAFVHMLAYLVPVLARNWRELCTSGSLWVVGLLLGLIGSLNMIALAITSSDHMVSKLGGKRWKRLHKTSYFLLAVILVHAVLLGTDFGIAQPADVKGEADFGALIGFVALAVTWLILFVLRQRGVRWIPRKYKK